MATNDSGAKRFLYGACRDFILGMKAVMPNGDIVVAGGKAVKNVAGYDITKMMIGSMGALGIVCEITFRITPRPDAEATLLFAFNGLKEGGGFLHKLLHSKYYPATLELINGRTAAGLKATSALKGKYAAAVAVEGIEEAVARLKKDLSDMGRQEGAVDVAVLDGAAHRDFWIAYRDLPDSLVKTHANLISLKVNVDLSKASDMFAACEAALREAGVEGALLCRAGNGILYALLPLGQDLDAKAAAVSAMIGRLTAEAVKYGGNLIIERAPRAIKEKVSVWGQTRSDVVVVRRLKEKMDPAGILNPGRYVGGI